MALLHIDTETYNEESIQTLGTYRHAETCELLLLQYALNDGPIHVIDYVNGEDIPDEFLKAFRQPDKYKKVAHNSPYDKEVLYHTLGLDSEPDEWHCTMAHALSLALPAGLGTLGPALGVPSDALKIKEGKKLIQRFCKPAPKNHKADRYDKQTHPDEWAKFIEYGRMDIEAMRYCLHRMPFWNYRGELYDEWVMTQRMNERGMRIDGNAVKAVLSIVAKVAADLDNVVYEASDGFITKTTQVKRIVEWMNAKGVKGDSLAKPTLKDILAGDIPDDVRQVLLARQQAAKASVGKYKKALKVRSGDGRFRGGLQWAGASRTMRWAGRLLQPQNMYRPSKGYDSEKAMEAIVRGIWDLMYDDVFELAASCVRGIIAASPGMKLISPDLSQIEARVLPWLACYEGGLTPFRKGLDPYIAEAAKMFNCDLDQVDGEQRFLGKIAVLSLGFQGGPDAFIGMGKNYGVDIDEATAQEIVDRWREANYKIKNFWYAAEEAAIKTMKTGESHSAGKLRFIRNGNFLLMRLPSGRYVPYPYPVLKKRTIPKKDGGSFTKEALGYMGIDSVTRKWVRVWTYGGKIVENATQAAAKDVMGANLPALEEEGYTPILLVHDEAVTEVPDTDEFTPEGACELLIREVPWAKSLPLAADASVGYRYKK